jgi:hypothetical protein
MLVLDESLPARQRQLLHDWRIRFRAISRDFESCAGTFLDCLDAVNEIVLKAAPATRLHFV